MDSKTLEKLEFNKIREKLSDYSVTYIGKKYCKTLMPMNEKKEIEKAQKQTSEALSLLYKLGNIPTAPIADTTIHITQLKNSNSLNNKQLLDLANILHISQNLKEYFDQKIIQNVDFPSLTNLFQNLYSNPSITKAITTAILDENTIDSNASPTLKKIRSSIFKKEAEIKSKLQSILHSKYVQEPIVTIRNNRFVIPVKSEYRSEVKGFVHDISASGSSIYIEPLAIFEINNEINNLHNDENIEIEKILMKLSSLFFDKIENIKNTENLIGLLDFIFAKASFSKELDCSEPIINNSKKINLIDCFHPLIAKDIVVKNTVELGENYTSLIITGPNTGGKTVILKMTGLAIIMGMSGLHIPAKSGSSIYIFDQVLADIGDEQSIADSLSTFSSHITNISHFLKSATPDSLVLVDELGSGTDPIEGSALAISILEHLNKKNILTIATTHYHEIKNYALITDGFENASVEFNFETLAPTYKLLIGVPGRSNAFIISKKLGISENIINRAKELIDDDTTSIEELLNNIYKDTSLLEEEKSKIDTTSREISEIKKSYQEKFDKLKQQEDEILANAKNKAREILLNAKEDANYIIRELESQKNAKNSNNLRKKLNEKIDNLSEKKSEKITNR